MDSFITYSEHSRLQQLFPSKADKSRMLAKAAHGWVKAERTLEQLAAHLDKGASIAAYFTDGHRCTESAVTQFIVLDFDEGNPDLARIEAALNPLKCAYITGETGSSQPGDRRYRVTIPLAESVNNARQFEDWVQRVIHCFPTDIQIDKASQKIAQPWFGHQQGTTRVKAGDFLSLEAIRAFPAPPVPEKPTAQHQREKKPAYVGSVVVWKQETSLWVEQEVMPQLDRVAPVQKVRGKYAYRHCPNPAHVDKHPSFRVSYDKSADGIGVCPCGSYSMTTVAQWIGAPAFMVWWKAERAPLFPKQKVMALLDSRSLCLSEQSSSTSPSATTTHERFFSAGVPDSWRETLLKIDGGAALTYEILTEGLRKGLIDPDLITIAALLETVLAMGWSVSSSTVHRGIKVLAAMFFSNLPTAKKEPSSVGKTEKKPKVGRTAETWALKNLSEVPPLLLNEVVPYLVEKAFPTEDTLYQVARVATLSARALAAVGIEDPAAEEELATLDRQFPLDKLDLSTHKRVRRQYDQIATGLNDSHSTLLAGAGETWKPRNPGQYRATYLRALKMVDVEVLRSHRNIAFTLGLKSLKTAAAIVRRAGLIIHGDQYEERTIPCTEDIEAEVSRIARYEVKGKPRYIVTKTTDGIRDSVYCAAEIKRQSGLGRAVTVKFQVANRHEVIEDAQLGCKQTCTRHAALLVNVGSPVAALPLPRDSSTLPMLLGFSMEALDVDSAATLFMEFQADPAPKPKNSLGYTPAWVRGQLMLRLKRFGWKKYENKLLNPDTGELVPLSAPADKVLSLLLGRTVVASTDADDLLEFAVHELGAVVTRLDVGSQPWTEPA